MLHNLFLGSPRQPQRVTTFPMALAGHIMTLAPEKRVESLSCLPNIRYSTFRRLCAGGMRGYCLGGTVCVRPGPGMIHHGRESLYRAWEPFVLSAIGRTGLGRFPLRIATRSRS